MRFYHVFLGIYMAVHARLMHTMLVRRDWPATFAKYGERGDIYTAAVCYGSKSSFTIWCLVMQGLLGVDFHTALVASFTLYAVELNVFLAKPTRTTVVYALGAAALCAEWALMRARLL